MLCPLTKAVLMTAWRRLSTVPHVYGKLKTMAPWRPQRVVQVEVIMYCIECCVSFWSQK